MPDKRDPSTRVSGGNDRIVVVGASAAGLTTVESLRRDGYAGRITLIGKESRLPYDRPPLSKQVLTGAWHPERTALRAPATYDQLDVDLLLGVPATGLDMSTQQVYLHGGERISYDKLVITTGVTPRRLTNVHHLAGVHVLRTLDDALALEAELRCEPKVVVIGAGFLGCEVAASARSLGLDVTLVDPLPVPMMRQFGLRLGQQVAELHRDHGVRLRIGTGVTRALGQQRVDSVELSDGSVIDADVVLVAIGSTPATEWLTASQLKLDDGLVCDSLCRAAPNIFAAGDVARWHNPRFDLSMRVEHRMNATEQAMAVASNLVGATTPFAPMPYFWTDQFDARIQAYGIFPSGCDMTITCGDSAERRFVAHFTHKARVVGVLGWNMPKKLREARNLITAPSS